MQYETGGANVGAGERGSRGLAAAHEHQELRIREHARVYGKTG